LRQEELMLSVLAASGAAERRGRDSDILEALGARYWSASVLPAIVGTVLPFWIRPMRYSFKWFGAFEFLAATVLMHAGFSLLLVAFENKGKKSWSRSGLIWAAAALIGAACLTGVHLSRYAPQLVLFVYGFVTVFAGLLYVSPPFSFHLRVGREIVLAKGLGFIAVLGAYLIQVGDMKRVVYVAAIPIVVSTWLWFWIEEMSTRASDIDTDRQTLVTWLGIRFSGRVVVPLVSAGILVTIVGAVVSGAVSPLALAALLITVLLVRTVRISWTAHDDPAQMRPVVAGARGVHTVVCLVLAASTLGALFR
jgi:1,4-dihydroxy-2-naphthoate octaprenyltransferase